MGGLLIVGSIANAVVLVTMGLVTPAISVACLAVAMALLVFIGFRREYQRVAKQARDNEWG
jgi:UDP-N-acetylmuramyl pentapeptide phosphotransferase/UDP-N-acetylglucosamine-1-phosphate transferase